MDRVHHLVGLVDAVGGGQPDLDPLLDLDERERIDLPAVEDARQEQPEDPCVEERGQHRLGQPALLVGALAQILEQRGQRIVRARHSSDVW